MGTKEHDNLVKEIDRLKKRLAKKEKEVKNLKVTNLFLGSLFDGISEEIMVIDNELNITDVNQAFLKRYGLKKRRVLGKKCYDIKQKSCAPCSMKVGSCPAERAGRTGEMVELTHSFKDEKGVIKEYVVILYPLRPDGEKTKYFLEITRDVSDLRHLIVRLQTSEKRLRAILDTATDAIVSINENQKIILFNDAAQEIFGYTDREIIGKDLNLLVPEEYGDHHRYLKRFLKSRKSDIMGRTISLTARRKDGEAFPIELSLSFLEMEGRITITSIIRDVTEQQKMENSLLQSERLAAVGETVAHVAHEIRNPLMIIGGFSNQIRKGLDNENDIRKIGMVLDEVVRLEKLVANLGDFTKEYKLVKRPADINSVIRDVIKIMTGFYSPEKYSFDDQLSDLVKEIDCDPDKLKQVFINVISNGLEAMQDGGTISIATEKTDYGVEIRISDEGIGITDEELKHIFEPFYTTRKTGSGLGLSISYKLIEAHNGDISAVSNPGKGTTFVIQLPAA